MAMQLPKSLVRFMCCALIGAAVLQGCSRNEVKKAATIPDTAETQSTPGPRKKPSRGSQYDTLWDRLFALYALPPIDHPDIDRELRWFANHPAYLERAQNRAEPFLYSIVKLVEKKNVPGELALLPIVESAFQPNVVSSARAAGIWQFIPSTGTNYGLKRSHSYDGRRDVYASTKAAIKYLRKLHGDFGDWLLAIAAYNCGEGAVGRAIRRNEAAGLPTDFWSLNLPQETRAYVPKLLAVSRLFADAEKYGISLKELPNLPQYKPVKVSNQLDLALAADAAGISLDKLYELNPGFKGQYADIDGSYHLYIPADKKAAEFRQEVERLSLGRRSFARPELEPEPAPVPVEPGAFQSFRREFAKRPPYQPDGKPVGGRFIPMSMTSGAENTAEISVEPPPPRLARPRAAPPPPEPVVEAEGVMAAPVESQRLRSDQRRAEPRDTASRQERAPLAPIRAPGMYETAVEVERVMEAPEEFPPLRPAKRRSETRDAAPRRESVSRRVMAAPPAARPAEPAVKKSAYSVQRGETLYGVARKHSVSVAELAKWNKIPITTEVQAGQKLVLAANEPEHTPAGLKTPHTMAAKEPKSTAKSSSGKPVAVKLAARQSSDSLAGTAAADPRRKAKSDTSAEASRKSEKSGRRH